MNDSSITNSGSTEAGSSSMKGGLGTRLRRRLPVIAQVLAIGTVAAVGGGTASLVGHAIAPTAVTGSQYDHATSSGGLSVTVDSAVAHAEKQGYTETITATITRHSTGNVYVLPAVELFNPKWADRPLQVSVASVSGDCKLGPMARDIFTNEMSPIIDCPTLAANGSEHLTVTYHADRPVSLHGFVRVDAFPALGGGLSATSTSAAYAENLPGLK